MARVTASSVLTLAALAAVCPHFVSGIAGAAERRRPNGALSTVLFGLDNFDVVGDARDIQLYETDYFSHALASSIKPHGHDAQEVTEHAKNAEQGVQAPFYAFLCALGVVMCVVLFFYGDRGWQVCLHVLIYLTALSTMKLTVKFVFVESHFPFAKFVTTLHFISGGIVCFLVLLRRQVSGGTSIPIPALNEVLCMLTPIAMAASMSIGANNMALTFSTVAFTEIVGSTTCLFTVAMVVIMGMPFEKILLIPTAAVALGCSVSSVGELHFSLVAMLLCFASNAFRALKVSLQQLLMTGASKDRFDPCALLLWVSIPSVIFMQTSSMVSEGFEPYRRMSAMDAHSLRKLWLGIGVSCVNAVVLNLAQLFITKDLGAVGGQLVAQAKSVLTVLGGMAMFGEAVTSVEIVGFILVLLGVYTFSSMEQAINDRKNLEKQKAKEAERCDSPNAKV